MGVIEDLSRRVDLLAQELTCVHNRIDEMTDSSVSAHKRITQLEQNLKDEIETLRERVQKIEDRLAPTCMNDTLQKVSTIPVFVTVRCRSGCHPVYSRVGHGDWQPVPASVAMTPPDLLMGYQFFVDGVLHEVCDIVNEHAVPEPPKQPSPVPGTWAWACEQMLAGKTVSRIGKSTGIKWHMKIDGSSVYCRATDDCMWQRGMVDKADLTATDWQVVS